MALLGGSFDPIHNSHLFCAKAVCRVLPLETVWLLPSNHSARKQPHLSPESRLELINLAIEKEPNLGVLLDEINQYSTSYTAATLNHIKQRYPEKTLLFIIGSDSLNGIEQWQQWQQILNFCHLIVIQRAATPPLGNPIVQQWLEQHHSTSIKSLLQQPSGCIYQMDINAPNIASSAIRAACKRKASYNDLHSMLPANVANHILEHQLYQ